MKIWYYKGMKNNIKSSITLPPNELLLVNELMKTLKAKSKVEVIRRGLLLLKDSLDRHALREAYQRASTLTREVNKTELAELDSLADEGLD
jgi:hypothetical protein